MTNDINDQSSPIQGEKEQFILLRFPHKLGKGIKGRLKSLGCSWNSLYHAWLCPSFIEQDALKAIGEAKLEFTTQIISLPKGLIPSDPKIANLQTHLDIIDTQCHKLSIELLQDVYNYNSLLRPEDFCEPPSEEGKSSDTFRIEMDFHNRWKALQKMKEDAESSRKELTHICAGASEKIFDPKAPTLIVEALIQNNFSFNGLETLQYCSDAFWEWDGMKYVEISETGMRQNIYNFLSDAKKLSDGGILENFNPDIYKVNVVIDALQAKCYKKYHPGNGPVWLDGRKDPNPKHLIAFQNGLLNIEEWMKGSSDIMPHTPQFLTVNALNFDFDPSAPDPKEWLQFLNSIWPTDLESQQVLQEWAGYLLTHNTSLHKILLIVGPPRSGKGTIGRVFHELLGTFNVAGPTLSSLGGEFGLQPLLNKMLATISDARLNGRGNNSLIIERLLSISGEDPLTINRKFLSQLTVQLSSRIMIMTNELPNMQDASGALAKRYLVLTLQKSWYDKEDTDLFSRLKEELPGILLWALQGLARLQQRGKFLQPSSSSQTIAELEAMTSPIKAFVAEKCEIKGNARVSVTDLFNAWRDWCDISGYPQAGNVQAFGKSLRAALPEIDQGRAQEGLFRERYYKGIALISFQNPSADVRSQNMSTFE